MAESVQADPKMTASTGKEIEPDDSQREVESETIKGEILAASEKHEVFQKTSKGVNFRTVGWIQASIIFLKVVFATGVLSIPGAMVSLGAVGGALSVIGWGLFNTYNAIVQGDFRNAHPSCHTIADMAEVVGGTWMKELTNIVYLLAWVIATGSGIVGVSVGLNALSHHAACTVWWAFLATVLVMAFASFRRFHQIGWLSWAGFWSIFIAVTIVVIAVTQLDRPAAAPQTGPFELGYYVTASPTFVAGMTASANIFVSSSGTSAFLPVIAEMRNPKDYKKAVFLCMGLVNATYLAYSLVVYRWCGQWVANPSLGSAGQTVKMVSYGIGLIGLLVSAILFLHVAAKSLFVRILRNTQHLQSNSMTHWAVWIGCIVGLGTIAFLLAQAVPVFNYLLALLGTVCFAPLAMILPGLFWLYDHGAWRTGGLKKAVIYYLHCGMILLGLFFFIGGTYATITVIVDSYRSGGIGSAFSCADNSNSS
ncbi:hypothetical protein B0A52_01271 [Exophiala mesophila]|uniref:Amino acid transporter transmembrane domain-containing protein n=1 Tax=Exophiala mesophila TaxID=212818 RepID=A0A438NGY3_EXOME|nr:hypothetical protein B0A52_01271 [Exophiala mesophila]